MNIYEKRAAFKKRVLENEEMLTLVGAFDGITARLVQHVGFDGAYMGGQATASTMFGLPDIGLVTASEQIKHAHDMASCIDLPFICDADTGYGNELNVRRTLHDLEDAGVYGAHFEDQVTPKRCGGMDGVQVVPIEEYVRKLDALVKYRRDPNFIIIGRTDSGSVYGVDEAIRRANIMADHGADMIFYGHTIHTVEELKRIWDETKVPVMYCMMEFSRDVIFSVEECRKAGVRILIWPNGLWMRWWKAAHDLMLQFKETGDPKTFFDELYTPDKCNELLGIKDWNPPRMF